MKIKKVLIENSIKSIENAEKQKAKLENLGYNLTGTFIRSDVTVLTFKLD